jgi:hypothetical protein
VPSNAPTLKGLGPFLQKDLCPACRILADTPTSDIAFCYGAAIVYHEAARNLRSMTNDLCDKHRGMVRALLREAEHPSGGSEF